MTTATITVHDDATPSAHYPADEQEANGAMDYSVTIEIGATDAIVDADEDEDDCLAAAAATYAEEHGLVGWDLSPRWTDDSDRETVTLSIPPRTIEGSITLYGDKQDDAGTPIDGWCSDAIVTWLRTLDKRAYRAAVVSLAAGVGTEDIEVSS